MTDEQIKNRCNFLNFVGNIRCLRCDDLSQERLKQLREHEEHLPLQKGDWKYGNCFEFLKMLLLKSCKEQKMSTMQREAFKARVQSRRMGMRIVQRYQFQKKHGLLEMRPLILQRKKELIVVVAALRNRASGIIDFPIIGGKSSLSQDARKREKWKVEMLERIKSAERRSQKNDESGDANIKKGLNYHQACDDVERAA
ncbi:uncharacterized protein LOC119995581 [Tripterygium wilfordii]|uniref:uncharacterized protein LOC119995581 n=1 Tax=Tripterygium wilfordii TaxID=458696 RepID=UPI0018F84EDA|nr:uncharacterized protein LOC119995581 [Tripterygium wilfordii]